MHLPGRAFRLDRRNLLIGGGVGAGLIIAWTIWPRRYEPNLRAGRGETLFGAFLKIGTDGRVIVAVPQAELGQGVFTSLPQILADELGADWKTVGVEPAPYNGLYANPLLAGSLTAEAAEPSDWKDGKFMLTGGSTSIRAFEPKLREAGAAARALLCKAAANRWDADWHSLEAHDGFVWNGSGSRLSFAELGEEAAELQVPDHLPMREGDRDRLVGASLPRLDLPSKVDGTAQFAGDIRLHGMLYASVRQGPAGARLRGFDRSAAERIQGVTALLDNPDWVAAVATNWWAANRAVEAMRPSFAGGSAAIGSADIDAALTNALASGTGMRLAGEGDVAAGMAGAGVVSASYSAGLAPTAAIEPLTATARFVDGQLEIWAAVQAPGFARAAAARALGLSKGEVTIYPTLAGGGYGRRLETAAIEQAAIIARKTGRPIQLSWSRIEETLHDSFRPPARATLAASLNQNGQILAWQSRIAAPATSADVAARLRGEGVPENGQADPAAVAGALPPYAIGATSIDHVPAALPIRTGMWRSAAHSYTVFFNESFIDELARHTRLDPLSFRMQMLVDNPRLAAVVSAAAASGGWDGGRSGSGMGLAAHAAYGSYAALMVDVELDSSQGIRVLRAVCAVDCGQVVNPDIVRQQVEGGIMFGIAAATASPIAFDKGLPTCVGFKDLGLPTLAQAPDIAVELMPSRQPAGGVTELSVPLAAPAIANAIFSLTGQRLRDLPLRLGRAA